MPRGSSHRWKWAAAEVPALGIGRRTFLRRLALAPAALALVARAAERPSPVRFGVITDIHQDVMPDGVARVSAFVRAMNEAKPDFVLQLGDFCQPHPRNAPFLAAWNEFAGPRHHVLGNHDMDGGFKPEQTVAFYGMPARYYAFNAGPVRGLVLDGNEPGGKAKGYKRFVGAEQLAWLERELKQDGRPVVVFIHQPIDEQLAHKAGYVENAGAVRAVLERAETERPGRVIAVFTGHLHLDYERVVNGLRHLQINSASYWWLANAKAARETYPPEIHQAHPYLKNVAAYRDPLWAFVTIDFARGELVLEGRRSAWIGPDPWDRGEQTTIPRELLNPTVSDRRVRLTAR